MNSIKGFIKKEFTFSIAFVLTCFSIVLNPNPKTYLGMIDFRVLIILFWKIFRNQTTIGLIKRRIKTNTIVIMMIMMAGTNITVSI